MNDVTAMVRAFEFQSRACAALGSPFSADLLDRAARDIAVAGPLTPLVAPWRDLSTRDLVEAAVPLRFLGAAHDLALSGEAPALAEAYPPAAPSDDAQAAWPRLLVEIAAKPKRFARFMEHEPQTNEVRRSVALLPGFLVVARMTGLPLRLFEIGASAGLNQLWDHYHYDLGDAGAWGDPASEVRLDAVWSGAPPPLDAPLSVASRAACDRRPADIRDRGARRRLKAYVWADQFERLARLDAALALALAAGTRVEAEDAVTWTARRVTLEKGAVTVLFHSVFWQYMPAASQATLEATIRELGRHADAAAPLAWLRMEPAADLARFELRLAVWPDGEDRLLAHVHPHGASVEWVGGGAGANV